MTTTVLGLTEFKAYCEKRFKGKTPLFIFDERDQPVITVGAHAVTTATFTSMDILTYPINSITLSNSHGCFSFLYANSVVVDEWDVPCVSDLGPYGNHLVDTVFTILCNDYDVNDMDTPFDIYVVADGE